MNVGIANKELNIPKPKLSSFLALEDLKEMSPNDVLKHFLGEYQAEPSEVARFDVLVAYESVGAYGCDSSSWFLLREKATGDLFEVAGSHCSCYGFEGQFEPEATSVKYLKSAKFSMSCGGYDNDEAGNRQAVKQWIAENL